VSSYYQYGKTTDNKSIRAYYIQPEVSVNLQQTTFRLGAEILSGGKSFSENVSHSFVPLYGVAWKFMGNMNLFTRFSADVADRGLVNPYFFVLQKVNKKLSLRGDSHLFYLQHPLQTAGNASTGKYLGYEADLSLNYKPASTLEIIFGYSFLLPHANIEPLGKVPDAGKTPVWSYLMVSYHPRLIRHSRNGK
jgi:hypothetical protein